MLSKNALLVLEDGTQFSGFSVGSQGIAVGELVFNTSITGYQEIITDPSYSNQLITFTYPHIGNTGITEADSESNKIQAAGLILKNMSKIASNWRSVQSLPDYLKSQNTIAIAGVDCRKITTLLRSKGSMKACIMAGDINYDQALQKANSFSGLVGLDLAKQVSCQTIYTLNAKTIKSSNIDPLHYGDPVLPSQYHVVAYDFGIKSSILHQLIQKGCHVTVVPATTTTETVLAMKPHGIFLSNGPGDPAACHYAIEATKIFIDNKIPVFGVCLGYQLIALACGATTSKMKFGHHGANHPVQDILTKKVLITSQNHNFAVNDSSLPDCLQITHRSLFDQSLQGLSHTVCPVFGFQGHPEASPGPHDANILFDRFIALLKAYII
ncbi:MAG: glutamine-hydrolyzing carbamoyl-phosphate synthase small subunit [Endozoicomonadaceae bacterium]|nr:glutamine-hydrolyzing carbamoyl-phosphate synthase small subunit [Endozoicomonadaceae bacterium]MBE8233196.1 glutamine-hydrolyzing carbamoyl-phosphate synthase small subunit [Endozoicomonadaceae bacterium]